MLFQTQSFLIGILLIPIILLFVLALKNKL